MKSPRPHALATAARLLATAAIVLPPVAGAQSVLPSGQSITPLAVPGAVVQSLNPGLPAYPNFVAGMALKSQLSPDGNTLAVLCAGHNSLVNSTGTAVDAANSTQYIFIYDVSGVHKANPVLTQVLRQGNAHVGLAFAPDGNTIFAAGGSDDAVYAYGRSGNTWALSRTIALGHAGKGVGLTNPPAGSGLPDLSVEPNASGLAVSADGRTLVVANNYNDSISVIDSATGTVRFEHDLRPYAVGNEGVAGGVGGTYPFGVVMKGNVAYVSSDRDREVVVIDVSNTPGTLVSRIKLEGNALGMTLDISKSRLYVAQDNADQVAVIDTASNTVIERIDARAPTGLIADPAGSRYTGAATFAVSLSPDGGLLYAVNAGANSVAVIPLAGPAPHAVAGLIPTGHAPHDVSFSADGSWMYIINGKSLTGPNPGYLPGDTPRLTTITYPGGNLAAYAASVAKNQYQFQLEKSSLVAAPVAQVLSQLPALTYQVAQNNGYAAAPVGNDAAIMAFLRSRIQHVIYVIKENRTFDQILGDLSNGANGSPALTQFGKRITPSFHKLASSYVTLDNFMDPGNGSMDGWAWSLQGRVTNTETITQQINYAFVDRGLSYESEGTNRNVPVNWPTPATRDATAGSQGLYQLLSAGTPGGTANLLPGTGNHASSDAPFGSQKGYIFNAVLQSGKTVRNYGFLVNNFPTSGTVAAPVKTPYPNYPQAAPFEPSLAPYTDLYFRGFDQAYPDLWRFNEWNREFQQYVGNGNLPALSMVRMAHDHMGSFDSAMAGINTPETQQADNDYAVGKLIETVAGSPYAANTLIFINEDDCQDGPDHVDSHRATAYVVGPYVKRGAVVSTRYSQVNVLRTIEDLLGTQHMNLNTAFQRPMADVFDISGSGAWSFTAQASTILRTTSVLNVAAASSAVRFSQGPTLKPRRTPDYWAKATRGMDFSKADRVPMAMFNRIIWRGLKGSQPYPMLASSTGTKTEIDDDDD
jgi:YVTN family beta-propeller protein